MGFFKSLKGKALQRDDLDQHQTPNVQSSDKQKNEYHSQNQSSETRHDSASHTYSETYAPPSGPPPTHSASDTNPPPYESWLSVPDNSQLPPPPNISNEVSPSNNASFRSAEMGHSWCARQPVYTPSMPRNREIIQASQQGELGFDPTPNEFKGTIRQLSTRIWQITTEKKQQDMVLTSALPIYFAAVSNPLLPPPPDDNEKSANPNTVTFAFSISISKLHSSAGIAIGFANKPYPPFRLPGWHRGSLAIHSDDGNRYINDPYGGIDFMRPFQVGDNIRLSMTIHPQSSPNQRYQGKIPDVGRVGTLPKCVATVQVERNGRVEGGWDIHEERDGERDEGIEGLQGEVDLYCAVGVFGATEFKVNYEGC